MSDWGKLVKLLAEGIHVTKNTILPAADCYMQDHFYIRGYDARVFPPRTVSTSPEM